MAASKPACESCGHELTCNGCDDNRPTAEDLCPGYLLFTPFGEWEHVAKTDRPSEYGPIQVFTKECGEKFSYTYFRTEKVDAIMTPYLAPHENPAIVAIVKSDLRMYVAAGTNRTRYGWDSPRSAAVLVEAGNGGRGKGWWVRTSRDWTGKEVVQGLTKAQARSAIMRHARALAKQLKMEVVVSG